MKNIKNIFAAFIMVPCLLLSWLVISCKTIQRFSGCSPLTVFVVDENDKPVIDFEILLTSGAISMPAVTNQNGLCIFYDMTSADYTVYPKNPGYIDSKTKFSFSNKNDVFCIKVYSYEYVFNQAEVFYERENYEAGIDLLKQLNTGKDQNLQNVKSFYLAYGYAALKQNKETKSELKKIKAEPPFNDSASKYKIAIQKMLE